MIHVFPPQYLDTTKYLAPFGSNKIFLERGVTFKAKQYHRNGGKFEHNQFFRCFAGLQTFQIELEG